MSPQDPSAPAGRYRGQAAAVGAEGARCWYCDRPIVPPVEIIGRWYAGTSQLVHKTCLTALAELDADAESPDAA